MVKNINLLGVLLVLQAVPVWAGRYVDNGNGTVTDSQTKLIWQQNDDGAQRDWEAAITYCENLTLAGNVNWRLPNFRALQSLVDDSRFNPAIDPIFTGTKLDMGYWSSTTKVDTPDVARAIVFNNGNGDQNNKGVMYPYFYTRCVSGGL
ncbi:MAG: DUF1566 domain-containing protein [Desulfobulbaceae bacterium]|nr:DUF1566 domain-containing protein [Desulfobulbaceae bacterium]